MPSNQGVVYEGPGKVKVESIDYPKFIDPQGRPIEHGVILKTVTTNICGSDQHMVRGRTTAPKASSSATRLPAKLSRRVRTSSSSMSATSSLSLSTLPADAVAPVANATPASAST
jgi:hypothetical protein